MRKLKWKGSRKGPTPRGKTKNPERIPKQTWETGITFPVKGFGNKFVSWKEAEKVYRTYVAMYGPLLSLEEIARQGGFTLKELRVWGTGHDFDGTKIL